MIASEREYQITRAEIERFEQALAAGNDPDDGLHPLLRQAMRDGLESQLQDLREQLAAYDAAQLEEYGATDRLVTKRSLRPTSRSGESVGDSQSWSPDTKKQILRTAEVVELIHHQLQSLFVVQRVAKDRETRVAEQLVYFIRIGCLSEQNLDVE